MAYIVRVIDVNEHEIRLEWDAVLGVYGYKIYRTSSLSNNANTGNGEIFLAKLGAEATSYTDKSVETNVKYYYRVWALIPDNTNDTKEMADVVSESTYAPNGDGNATVGQLTQETPAKKAGAKEEKPKTTISLDAALAPFNEEGSDTAVKSIVKAKELEIAGYYRANPDQAGFWTQNMVLEHSSLKIAALKQRVQTDKSETFASESETTLKKDTRSVSKRTEMVSTGKAAYQTRKLSAMQSEENAATSMVKNAMTQFSQGQPSAPAKNKADSMDNDWKKSIREKYQ
jgi:hypothetical protein